MDDASNISSNSDAEVVPLRRRPGPPKGTPRPPGAGRKKGTPNRHTRDVRVAAQKHSADAIATLVKLLKDPDSRVQATAAREILDRAHGRPMQATEISGPNGAPIETTERTSIERARRIAFAMSRGLKEMAPPVAPPAPDVLVLTPEDIVPLNAPSKPSWYNDGKLPEYDPPMPTAEEIGRAEADRHVNRASGVIDGRGHVPVVRRNP